MCEKSHFSFLISKLNLQFLSESLQGEKGSTFQNIKHSSKHTEQENISSVLRVFLKCLDAAQV